MKLFTTYVAAVFASASKLPFSRVVNYVVAKNMIVDLFQDDNTINLINDIDKNEYSTINTSWWS